MYKSYRIYTERQAHTLSGHPYGPLSEHIKAYEKHNAIARNTASDVEEASKLLSGLAFTDVSNGSVVVLTDTTTLSADEATETRLRLRNLPKEMALRIFEILAEEDQCAAVCLGLVCSRFYDLLKTCLSKPINIWQGDTVQIREDLGHSQYRISTCHRLQLVVMRFLGDKYRLPIPSTSLAKENFPLLSRVVSKDRYIHQEIALHTRFRHRRYVKDCWSDPRCDELLPSTFGRGLEWCQDVRQVLLKEGVLSEVAQKLDVVVKKKDLLDLLGCWDHYFEEINIDASALVYWGRRPVS